MTRKKWREATLNEYVDGRLPEPQRRALEAQLAHDPALRAEVTALRQTVSTLRAVPLREPPRNYLLTPGMVTVQPRKSGFHPRPLVWRWAAGLSAIVFIAALGMTLLSSLMLGGTQQAQAPAVAVNMSQPTSEAQTLRSATPPTMGGAAPEAARDESAIPRTETEPLVGAAPPNETMSSSKAPSAATEVRPTPQPTCPPQPTTPSVIPLAVLGLLLMLLILGITVAILWKRRK